MPTSKDSTDALAQQILIHRQNHMVMVEYIMYHGPGTICQLDDMHLCIWYGSLLTNNVLCSANCLTGISKRSHETGILFERNGGAQLEST